MCFTYWVKLSKNLDEMSRELINVCPAPWKKMTEIHFNQPSNPVCRYFIPASQTSNVKPRH